MTATIAPERADERVRRLNEASVARFTDIDEIERGRLGDGQLIPDELLSIAGLGIELTAEQRRTLAREEVASILNVGVEFECVLMAALALEVIDRERITDPRAVYALHEIGEETRHSRLFISLVDQIGPTARNPFRRAWVRPIDRRLTRMIVGIPGLTYTLILGGEEIPDLLQKLVGEHPDSDPHLRAVNRYHRSEEARHLGFARTMLPEVWANTGWLQHAAARYLGAGIVGGMWDTLVHPGVYRTVGLPGWKTWRAVRKSPTRAALRHQATRPVLASLIQAGAIRAGHVPRGWRQLCGVDRNGEPVA